MKFSHPLARSAKIWPAQLSEGTVHNVLTIVTTLELDPEHRKFKTEHVERLKSAARDFLSENPAKASGFMLLNKPKS